jgi:uncharacterized membrane protein
MRRIPRKDRAGGGVAEAPVMDVDALREELRHGRSAELARRRAIATLAAVGLVDFAAISLYQLGVIRHLPDPPGRLFDSDAVNGSRAAYAHGVPDGTTGALLYALELVLASAGGSRRTGRRGWLDLALGGAIGAGVAGAAFYLWDMGTREKKACPYCLVGAGVNFAMAPLWLRAFAAARRS